MFEAELAQAPGRQAQREQASAASWVPAFYRWYCLSRALCLTCRCLGSDRAAGSSVARGPCTARIIGDKTLHFYTHARPGKRVGCTRSVQPIELPGSGHPRASGRAPTGAVSSSPERGRPLPSPFFYHAVRLRHCAQFAASLAKRVRIQAAGAQCASCPELMAARAAPRPFTVPQVSADILTVGGGIGSPDGRPEV